MKTLRPPIAERRARVRELAANLPHSENEVDGLLVEARTAYDAVFGLALAAAPACLVAAATAGSFPMLVLLIASGVAFGVAYSLLRRMEKTLNTAPSTYLRLAWRAREARILGGGAAGAEAHAEDLQAANTKVWDDLETCERGIWRRSLATMAAGTVLLVLGLGYQGRDVLRSKEAETAQAARVPVAAPAAAAPAGVGGGKVAAPAPGAARGGGAGKPGQGQGSTDTATHGRLGAGPAPRSQRGGERP